MVNPTTRESSPNPAEGEIYKTTTDFVLATGQGIYQPDETIYQYDAQKNVLFSATVLSFDNGTNVLKLINTTGTYVLNSTVFGNTSQTARTLLTVSLPNFVLYSGHIIFVENRSGVQRSTDGIEQFKFVLGY